MTTAPVLAGFMQRDWRIARSYKFPFLLDVLGLIAGLAVYYFISEFLSRDFFAFALAGLIVLRMHIGLSRTIVNLETEIASGTMEETLAQLPSASLYLVGSLAFEIARAFVLGLIMLVLAKVIFSGDIDTGPAALAAVVVGQAGAGAMFTALGAMIAGAVLVVRQGTSLVGLVGLALPIIAGAYFPLSALPPALEAVAEISPFRLPVDVIRQGILEGTFAFDDVGLMAAWAVALLAAGLAAGTRGVAYGRRTAGLSRP